MKFTEILFEINNHVATLTLNRPDNRNVITDPKMIDEIEVACKQVNDNFDIKVLIITGTDPAFSSGGNIKEMLKKEGMFKGNPAELMESYRKNIQRVPLALYSVEVPTIAAVNGPAIGAGCDLALMCDLRVASEKAKFGETFLSVGLIPGDGGAYFLSRIVGLAKACEMTFTGKIIEGQEALQIGLINNLTKHQNLMVEANKLAGDICKMPARALRMSKRLIYMGLNSSLPNLLEQSAAYQSLCHFTDDHHEALNSIFDKRSPKFTGK